MVGRQTHTNEAQVSTNSRRQTDRYLVREGSDAPIGELVLLVCGDVAEGVEEVREREGREFEDARRLARVEHVHDVHPKVALQPRDVAVRAVQHLTSRHHKDERDIDMYVCG